VPHAEAGTRYRFRINGNELVPDPASRCNPEGVHGASVVVDARSFVWDDGWQGRPWSEVVLYELHVGTFTQEGTFRAAEARLAELAQIGITAVELMPLAAFSGRFGWGYDGVLPFAPHAAYGNPDELRSLVQTAHRLGLMVFVDVVYNHFGPDGNYLHAYAQEFFSKEHHSPWGAAINFDGSGSHWVREYFKHNALYWIEEFQIDGLRLDAVHAIADTSAPDILEEISAAVRASAPGRHVHLVLENENNEYSRLTAEPMPGRYDGQWNDDFHHALHVAMTGDNSGFFVDYGREPMDLLARTLTHGMLFEGSPRKLGGARERIEVAPPQPLPTLINFANNHDQVGNRAFGERLSQLLPPEAAPLATLLALLTPATPMLFFGDEVGSPTPFLYFADWDGELREAVRKGRAREFNHAVDEDGPALPDPCSADTFEASRPLQPDVQAGQWWLDLVTQALAARRQFIIPRQRQLLTGQHTARRIGDKGVAVQWRYDNGQELALELNLGAEPIVVDTASVGPVEARDVFSYRRSSADPQGTWPAWSARWTIGAEITQ
jgi:1,4-alpha-glucan branching enzyme/maltooligosyltrehalose trehalohydrolase